MILTSPISYILFMNTVVFIYKKLNAKMDLFELTIQWQRIHTRGTPVDELCRLK
jgi:hypothetical protein